METLASSRDALMASAGTLVAARESWSNRKPALGLDIGGTKLATGVLMPSGVVAGALVGPTPEGRRPDESIDLLFEMGRESLAAADVRVPSSVGIACGGPLDSAAGLLIDPVRLPGWAGIAIAEMAEAAFHSPAFVENDASAGAIGEFLHGTGTVRGASSLVYLTISTGIGGGIIINGHLHHGTRGNGGELGHVTVHPGGLPCACGRRGCLEAYCSGTSIAERANLALARRRSTATTLRDCVPVTAADVSAAAAAGDAFARQLWRETTALLAQAVVDLSNVLEPDLFVLGGGVTESGNLLLDPVRAAVRAECMAGTCDDVEVAITALGQYVCVVGAAAVAALRSEGEVL